MTGFISPPPRFVRPASRFTLAAAAMAALCVGGSAVRAQAETDQAKLGQGLRGMLAAQPNVSRSSDGSANVSSLSPLSDLANTGRLKVVIRLETYNPFIVARLHEIKGLELIGSPVGPGELEAWATPAAIEQLESLEYVRNIGLAPRAYTKHQQLVERLKSRGQSLPVLPSEEKGSSAKSDGGIGARAIGPFYRGAGRTSADAADSLELSTAVPSAYNVTGEGVRVGVISDGVSGSSSFHASPADFNGLGDWPAIDPPYLQTPDPADEPTLIQGEGAGALFYAGQSASEFPSGIGFRSFAIDYLAFYGFSTGSDILSSTSQHLAIGTGLSGPGSVGDEGGGMIEIVHDVAPYAEKYFANFNSVLEFNRAKTWLANEAKCEIVVDDIGYFAGDPDSTNPSNQPLPASSVIAPLDGTNLLGVANDEIVRNGSLYMNAAGNDSGDTYFGVFTDANNNGIHDFRPFNPSFPGAGVDESLDVNVFAPGTAFILSWLEPRGRAGDDIDFKLFNPSIGPSVPIATSVTIQDGRGVPTEAFVCPSFGTFGIQVFRKNTSDRTPRPFQIRFLGSAEIIDPEVLETSYDPNSSSRLAANIGAVPYNVGDESDFFLNHNVIEEFSARGRTMDGRLRPDLAGHDGVRTATFVPQFFGTSAAAPHVAGVAALAWQLQRTQGFEPQPLEVLDIVRIAAVQIGGRSRRDLVFGGGRLNAGRLIDGGRPLDTTTGLPNDDTAARLPGIGLNYFQNRSVSYDLSLPAIRNRFVTSANDPLLTTLFTPPIFRGVNDGLTLDGIQLQGVDNNTYGLVVTPNIDFDMIADGRDGAPDRDGTYLKLGRVYEVTVNVASDTQTNFAPFRLRAEASEFQNITEYVVNPINQTGPSTTGTDYTFWFVPRDRPALAGFRIAFDYYGLGFEPGRFNAATTFTVKRISIREILPRRDR